MSFKEITPEEYDQLVENKNKIFDLTQRFTSPEILNKYRNDENISKKIENLEQEQTKNEN